MDAVENKMGFIFAARQDMRVGDRQAPNPSIIATASVISDKVRQYSRRMYICGDSFHRIVPWTYSHSPDEVV